ncbi:hypothetical protein GCM10022399_37480 [Terrabacter ginsenosidimutans]|uniref:Uncharacterized protein n=1 Tax=Terrabacter ginsenosidimutans TaxID=490575 RepID=A0ABP7ECS6_9MICO
MRKPGLKQLIEAARDPKKVLRGLGPRRAVIQCRHEAPWGTLAEVRDDVVVADGSAHDLNCSYDISVRCHRCAPSTGRQVLDVRKIRAELAKPHRGVLKLDIEKVSRPPRER